MFRYFCTRLFILVYFNSKKLEITPVVTSKVIAQQMMVHMSIQPLKIVLQTCIY